MRRVALGTWNVTDDVRRVIAHEMGSHGKLASRAEVVAFAYSAGWAPSSLDDPGFAYEDCEQCHPSANHSRKRASR